MSPKPPAKVSPTKPVVKVKAEPVIELEDSSKKSSQQPRREAIWIVETDSDNDDADQPGPSGLQLNSKKDSGPEKKDADKSQ